MQGETLTWDGLRNVDHEARLFTRVIEMIYEKFGYDYATLLQLRNYEATVKEFIISAFTGVSNVVMEGMVITEIQFSETHYFSEFLLSFDLNFPASLA